MDLPRGPRRLIEHLKTYCRKQPYCWPSVKTLAVAMRRKRRTIFSWLSILTEAELIERDQRGQTSAMIFLKPECFQRDWLHFGIACTAFGTAFGTARTAVPITERSTLSEEERPPVEKEQNHEPMTGPEWGAFVAAMSGEERSLLARARALYAFASPENILEAMEEMRAADSATTERKPPERETGQLVRAATEGSR